MCRWCVCCGGVCVCGGGGGPMVCSLLLELLAHIRERAHTQRELILLQVPGTFSLLSDWLTQAIVLVLVLAVLK